MNHREFEIGDIVSCIGSGLEAIIIKMSDTKTRGRVFTLVPISKVSGEVASFTAPADFDESVIQLSNSSLFRLLFIGRATDYLNAMKIFKSVNLRKREANEAAKEKLLQIREDRGLADLSPDQDLILASPSGPVNVSFCNYVKSSGKITVFRKDSETRPQVSPEQLTKI